MLHNSKILETIVDQASTFKKYIDDTIGLNKNTRSDLYCLKVTLERFLFDINKNSFNKIIYITDASEYYGYVDPEDKDLVQTFFFNLTKEKNLKIWRKYRYEVLLKKFASVDESIYFHSEHVPELLNLHTKLNSNRNDTLDDDITHNLINILEIQTDKESVERKLKSDDPTYINFLDKISLNLVKYRRFFDFRDNGYRELLDFNWDRIDDIDESTKDQLRKIEPNEDLSDFFRFTLNLKFHRDATFITDARVLAYTMQLNELLINKGSSTRFCYLTSSRLINNLSRYIIDYFSEFDSSTEKEAYNLVNDIIYVRHPVLLLDYRSYKNNKINAFSEKVLTIVNSLIGPFNSTIPNRNKQILQNVKIHWYNLLENLYKQENIIITVSENKDIDLNEVLSYLKNENKEKESLLVNSYIINLILSKNENFSFYIRKCNFIDLEGNVRYFLRSTYDNTSNNIYQFPKSLLDQNFFSNLNNSSLSEEPFQVNVNIKKFKEYSNTLISKRESESYQSLDFVYYKFSCLLLASIFKDWEIVLSVSNDFIANFEKIKQRDLLEEVYFFNHLAYRVKLFDSFYVKGINSDNINIYKKLIDQAKISIDKSISLNTQNPRSKLAKQVFIIEELYVVSLIPEILEFNDIFSVCVDEFNSGSFYKSNSKDFNNHCFADELHLMYFKHMLVLLIFCHLNKDRFKVVSFEKEKIENHYNSFLKYHNKLNAKINHYGTELVKLSFEYLIKKNKIEYCDFENACKYLPKNSFLRRAIGRPIKDLVLEKLDEERLE